MLNFKQIEQAGESSSIMMCMMICEMVEMMRELKVEDSFTVDGLLIGLRDAEADYRRQNPSFDPSDALEPIRAEIKAMKDRVTAARDVMK